LRLGVTKKYYAADFTSYRQKILELDRSSDSVAHHMCMHSAGEDGKVTNWHKVHYGARAQGQVALIFPETLAIQKDGRIAAGDLRIWSDEHIADLKELVDLLHSFGAKAGAQIGHGGRATDLPGIELFAPSPIPFREDGVVPTELTVEGIVKFVSAFGDAARRAKQAGFDVLEIHAAHGYYLMNEFLSPYANKRTDEYGGSQEGRYRFLRETIEEVKKHWNGPLFMRISSSDYVKGGNTPEDFVAYASG
jgi:NADPH2 dehydrogenase